MPPCSPKVEANTGAAKKDYNKQNYYAAVEGTLEALAKNPDFPEAVELFKQAFNEGNDAYLKTVNAGKDPEDYQGTINAYGALKALIALNTLAADSGRKDVTTTDYSAELEPARQFMLESNYNMGLKLLDSGNKKDIRTSAAFFRFVLNEEPGYADGEAKLAEAKEAGMVDVAFSISDDSFLEDVQQAFSGNEWIRIAPLEAYPGYNLAGPMDQMMSALQAGKLDYVVRADLHINYETSKDENYNETVIEAESFSASGPTTIKTRQHTYSWTREAGLDYKVYGPGVKLVKEGSLENNGGDSFTYHILPNNDIDDISFDGKKYHFSINELPRGYSQTDIGALVMNLNGLFHKVLSAEEMTDYTDWLHYFEDEYFMFSDFQYLKEDFEGQVFSESSLFKFSAEDGTDAGYAPIFRTTGDMDRYAYSIQMSDISGAAASGMKQFLNKFISKDNIKDYDYSMTGSSLTSSLCEEVGGIF